MNKTMTDDYDYSHLLIDGDCDCGECSDPSAIEPDCGSSFVCRRCDKRWSADFGSADDTPGLCDSCSVDVQEGWEATPAEDNAESLAAFPHSAQCGPITLSRKDFNTLLLFCTKEVDPNPALVELFQRYS